MIDDANQTNASQNDAHQNDAHQNDAHQNDTHQNDAHQNDAGQASAFAGEPVAGRRTDASQAAGFCQNCGRPLTTATVRQQGNAILCGPCMELRAAASAAGQTSNPAAAQGFGYNPGSPYPMPPVSAPGVPNPGLAALLGLIPGVGAMYNEQYAKGFVHLLVFVILVALTDSNGIFLIFVFGWEFYMALEAHHTAKARRDGLLLPNPFGLNDIGERLGFGRSWPGRADVGGFTRDAAEAVAQGFRGGTVPPQRTAPWGAPSEAYAPAGYWPAAGVSGPEAAASPNFASSYEPGYPQPGYPQPGYPQAGTPQGQAGTPQGQAGTSAPYTGQPYGWSSVPTPPPGTPASAAPPPAADPGPYHGPYYGIDGQQGAYGGAVPPGMPPANPYGAVPPGSAMPPLPPPASRVPAGAIWLIGLGTLFLLLTTGRFNGIPGHALLGLGLVALSGWLFYRRMAESGPSFHDDGTPLYRFRLMRALRGSAWVALVGLWFLLDAFHILRMSRSWPLFIILAGVLALLERATLTPAMPTVPPVPYGYNPGPFAGAQPGPSGGSAANSAPAAAPTSMVVPSGSTARAGFTTPLAEAAPPGVQPQGAEPGLADQDSSSANDFEKGR